MAKINHEVLNVYSTFYTKYQYIYIYIRISFHSSMSTENDAVKIKLTVDKLLVLKMHNSFRLIFRDSVEGRWVFFFWLLGAFSKIDCQILRRNEKNAIFYTSKRDDKILELDADKACNIFLKSHCYNYIFFRQT